MINNKLNKNAKKIDNYLLGFLKKQKKSLLLVPMKYGVISGGKKIRSKIIVDLIFFPPEITPYFMGATNKDFF